MTVVRLHRHDSSYFEAWGVVGMTEVAIARLSEWMYQLAGVQATISGAIVIRVKDVWLEVET